MTKTASLGIALALLGICAPARAEQLGKSPADGVVVEPDTQFDAQLLEGVQLLSAGKPAPAIKIFDAIIAAYEAKYGTKIIYRCATPTSAKDTIADALQAALATKGKTIVIGSEEWCTALWGKGFALIDLGKTDEAGLYLARAVEMDPMNAHFINEYAEWFKPQRKWQQSYDLFLRAWRTVDHDKKGPNRRVAARSLRGMAFNLIELGNLKEAERLYRQSLEYEPEAAAKVQNELDYIADAQAKQKAS